jgi:hypothetical protein
MRLGGRLSELSIIIVAIVRVGVNIVHATILDKELWINILNVAKQKNASPALCKCRKFSIAEVRVGQF